MEQFYIDPEAKSKIELTKILDANGQPYYIGKLQFPGKLEFACGASFFVFVSEDGVEELQIAPLDPSRRNKSSREGAYLEGDRNEVRISIDLHPMSDQNGNTYYVGEAIGLTDLNLRNGIFFTVFVSKTGQEEIQITRLNHKRRRRYTKTNYVEVQRTYPRRPMRQPSMPPEQIDSSPP
jgi:hypothetical protein